MTGHRQIITFVFCGGLAACANMGARWVLSHWLPFEVSIVIAYCIGMVTGFLLFKIVVFTSAHSQNFLKEIVWYIIINILSLAQTLGLSILLAKYIFPKVNMHVYPEDIAHMIGVGIPVITSYLGHKYLTFGAKKRFSSSN